MSALFRRPAAVGPIALPDPEKANIDESSLPLPNTTSPSSSPFSSTKGNSSSSEAQRAFRRRLLLLLLAFPAIYVYLGLSWPVPHFPNPVPKQGGSSDKSDVSQALLDYGLQQCHEIQHFAPPRPSAEFSADRTKNDRFVEGTRPVLLTNGTLWTGEKRGEDVVYGGSVWLDNGLIKKVGDDKDVRSAMDAFYSVQAEQGLITDRAEEIDLGGKWVTPGLIDLHSHAGVDAEPGLRGTDDTNSVKTDIQPYLRSIDGFNTHDAAFQLSMAGGVTSMLVLPGSATSIGGSAFFFKPRPTHEDTPSSMLVEPPFVTDSKANGTTNLIRTGYWRHMKSAFGENPMRVFNQVRMNSIWDWREGLEKARALKRKQDAWCSRGDSNAEAFPEELQWEALVDVLRGRVKLNSHIYGTNDIDSLVHLTNEFQFHVSVLHHAHSNFLVPGALRKMFGGPPSSAIFAQNSNYKAESYRNSEYSGYILSEYGFDVQYKTDHPVLQERFLLYEAQQGHRRGLNFSTALNAVTTTPAKSAGKDHRLGYLRQGYDADLVVWDSFPLTLGATPVQTYIDQIPQIENPVVVVKGEALQKITSAGDTSGAADDIKYRGNAPLRSKHQVKNIIFQDVTALYLKNESTEKMEEQIVTPNGEMRTASNSRIIIEDGQITCTGTCVDASEDRQFELIDLKGGYITAGLISYGSPLGLKQIDQEPSTSDGKAPNPLTNTPLLDGLVVKAADGATFDGKNQLIAYREGVTTGVAHPIPSSPFYGLSYSYDMGARHPLDGGIQQEVVAMHIGIGASEKLSVSAEIGILRSLLAGDVTDKTELSSVMKKVAKGEITLVAQVSKADVMAQLIRLKQEVGGNMRLTFEGAEESWIVSVFPSFLPPW